MQETDMESLDPHDDRPDDRPDPADESADDAHDDTHDSGHDVSEDEAGADETAYPGAGGRDVPTAPTTGDAVVDAAMVELAAAEAGSLAERIDAGERADRVLQGRLSDLGGA
jgi:hypothetical protein